MIKQMVLIASLLASSNVFAEVKDEWIKVAKTADAEDYLNPAYIKFVQGSTTQEVEYWIKAINIKADPTRMLEIGDFIMTKEVARCSDGSLKLVSSTIYRNGNARRVNLSGLGVDVYFDPEPNSAADVDVNAVCSMVFPHF